MYVHVCDSVYVLCVCIAMYSRDENNSRPFADQISNIAAHFLTYLSNIFQIKQKAMYTEEVV